MSNPNIRAAIKDGAFTVLRAATILAVVVLAHIGAQQQWDWVREQAGVDYDTTQVAIVMLLLSVVAGVIDGLDTYIRQPYDPDVVTADFARAESECPGCGSTDMPLYQVTCDSCNNAVQCGTFPYAKVRQWERDQTQRMHAARAIAAQTLLR